MKNRHQIHKHPAHDRQQAKQRARFEEKQQKTKEKKAHVSIERPVRHKPKRKVYTKPPDRINWMLVIFALLIASQFAIGAAATATPPSSRTRRGHELPAPPDEGDHASLNLAVHFYNQSLIVIPHGNRLFSDPHRVVHSDSTYHAIPAKNIDLRYSLTHYDYDDIDSGRCQVTQLKSGNIGRVKILDFWGEGRIVDGSMVTGFPNAYNVNHQTQKVSNGEHKGHLIPNRIPVRDFKNVDLADLVADGTFQYVTTMGAPVTQETADEMYRVARKDINARIIFYGTERDTIKNLQVSSQEHFIHMKHSTQYIDGLEAEFRVISIRPINTIVPIKKVMADLERCLTTQDMNSTATILLDLNEYCRQRYSCSDEIIQQVRSLCSMHVADRSVLTEELLRCADSSDQIRQIDEMLGAPERRVSLYNR